MLEKLGGDRTGPNIEMTMGVIMHKLIFMVQQGSLYL